ncbi:hypothetical protein CTAYLR_006524 [Chrysophaeum taylorii]|uniref:CHAT domain-containing protein n=1 Tax=Chrysophaeum taylorii TaxID=2483200 RepID=A0AAD7UH92_9STRA|nr:hypothetical protein CTAYLR_006524 [Chrysophaeum taylorii]
MANEQTWYEDESTGNELRRALRTSAAAAEASPSPGFESSDAVIRHLQSKFGIGDARKLDEASMLIETSQPGDGSLDNQGDETADATAAETLTHGRAADAPALRPHTSQQTEVRSIAPPRDSADNEGVTHMGVLVVDDDEADNAGKILVSVWDFGGQPVFQVVQHLYMPRIGVYAVVFRLIDLLLEPEREAHQAALKYLDFWLHSIDTYATYPRREEREIRFPPIVLVGTYLDDLAKQPEEERLGKLRQVNGVLLENFKNRISCLQADQSSRIKGREFLYNEAQDLCYFPVDNTIDDDKNVRCLREVIVRAIKEDALQYIHDPIPTSWLRVFDKLETVRDSHPRLAVHEEDDDDDEDSVVQLMLEAGALSREDPIEARKSRAVAMLQYFHFFGAVVYFDDVPGLQHHALIGPQWVLDSITFVVRDFRLHRFRRDRKAMDINDGKDWLDLISNGIATEKLLRRLWIGERLAYDFLVSLMIQLGLFARLSDGRFLVPSSVCATTIQGASNGEPAGIQAHLDGSEMRLDGRIPCFEFQDGFLPNGFFERVVNKLVNDWPTGAAGEALVPELRPNAAFLHLQSHPLVILKAWPTIRVYIRLGEAARRALEAVDQAVACTQMRSSVRRSFSFSETLDDDPFFGWRELAEAMISERELLTCELAREEIRDLYDFFKNKVKPKGKANVAAEYTKRILSERSRANLEDLKYMQVTYLDSLNKDKDNHLKPGGELEALLQDCEIKNADQWKIWRLLHQNYRIVKGPGPFLFGIFAGAGLDHLRLERVEIGNLMSAGCLGFDCKIFDELTVSKLEKALDNGCGKVDNRRGRVLHFAMHGTSSRTSMPDTRVIGAEAKSTRTTLQVYGDDLKVIEAEPLARIVAKRCTDEQVQFYDNNFECVFLNCCESDTAARKLKEFNVPWVLSWTTPVDDEAAKTFAEGFYRWLAGNPGDYKGAFEKGKKELTDHLWIIEDPTNSRCGQKSGIPRLRGPTNPKYLPPPPEPSTLEIKDIAFMKETLATLHKTFLQYLNAELQYPKLFFVVKFPTSYGLVADRLINEQLMVVFVCEKTKKRARYEVDGKDVGGLIVTAMKPSVRKFIKRVDDFWHRFGPIVKITAALVVTAVKATTSVDLKEFVPSALMETSKDSKGTHDFITRYAEDAGAKVDESLADGMVTEVATAGLEAAGIDHSTLKSILPAKGFEQIQNMKFNRKTFLEFGDFLVAAGYDRKCLCMDIDTIGDSGAGWIARDVDRPTQRVDDLPPQKKVMKTIELTKKAMKEATERTDPQRADVERVDDFVDQGLDVTLSILSTGRALPLISEACGVAGAILKDVQKYKDKADDVVQAGRRVLDVLEFLRLLTSRVRELSPESTSEVRAAMADITQLLEEFKTAVEKFGKPGFFKRFWKQREYAGTLSRLDGEIRDKLDFLTNAYGLARDAQVEGLPRAITYKLEEALEKYVDERHDKDERALENAAKEGGVDAEETTMALVALHQKVELEKDLVREMAQSREYGRHEVLKQALEYDEGAIPHGSDHTRKLRISIWDYGGCKRA